MNPAFNPAMQPPMQAAALLQPPAVDVAALAKIQDAGEKRQFVGNNIYPVIEGAFGNQFAGRITGMLLDENVVNFQELLTNPAYLTQKAREAMNLLL